MSLQVLFILLGFLIGTTQVFGNQTLDEQLYWHPLRQKSTWENQPLPTYCHRLQIATPIVLNYLFLQNQQQHYNPAMVFPVELSAQEKNQLELALCSLPLFLRKLENEQLKGIFVVSNMATYAKAEYIQDKNGAPWGGMIFLDWDKIKGKKLNQLVTEKEIALWKGDAPSFLSVSYIDDSRDSIVQNLRYILMHEMAHLMAVGRSFHPNWWVQANSRPLSQFIFAPYSWENSTGFEFVPKEKSWRTTLPMQGAARYRLLQQSSFTGLYASSNLFEDFAESVATYFWEKEGHHRSVKFFEDGKWVKMSLPSLNGPLRSAKKKVLDQFIQRL